MEPNRAYIQMLKAELNSRKQLNSAYSLRAFARDLEISAPQLSMILSGKKGLSKAKAVSLAQHLSWTQQDRDIFIDLVDASHSRSLSSKEQAYIKIQKKMAKRSVSLEKFIEDDVFKNIAEPIHFQIIEALKLSFVSGTIEEIFSILPYTEEEIRGACKRLIQLNLIQKDKTKLKVDDYKIVAGDRDLSHALRLHHSSQLKLAQKAISEQDVQTRCLSSLTVAIPEELIPEVFQKITSFRKEVNDFIIQNTNQKKTKIYSLNTQFFKVNKEKS